MAIVLAAIYRDHFPTHKRTKLIPYLSDRDEHDITHAPYLADDLDLSAGSSACCELARGNKLKVMYV